MLNVPTASKDAAFVEEGKEEGEKLDERLSLARVPEKRMAICMVLYPLEILL